MSHKGLLNAVKNNELQRLSIYLTTEEEKDVNTKDSEGWTLLHYAVINENVGMVKALLKNGADPTQVNNQGDTPLHIAARKGCLEIVNILLKHATICQISYINTKTSLHEETPLHIAAGNGFMDVVISLLRHGAIYNIKNKYNQIPLELSKAYSVAKTLHLINECFEKAETGDMDLLNKLNNANIDQFSAIMNSRNSQNHPLIQEAMVHHHHKLTAKLLDMRADIDYTFKSGDTQSLMESLPDSTFNSSNTIEKLKQLKSAVENYLTFSTMYYLPELRNMSKAYGLDKNILPGKTLKTGSYLLSSIQDLIDEYKNSKSDDIDDENMKLVNDTLIYLQFDRSHVTLSEDFLPQISDDPGVENVVSRGHGRVYYNLLHSEKNADVRVFIDIVEKNFNTPVERFLETVTQKLKSFL